MLLLLLSAHLIAAQNWRYPDCRDLEITTIEMPTAGSNELFITVFNHCDTCSQHVYTGLMAFRGSDTLATEDLLFSKPSPENKMDYRYKLLVDEPFEFTEDIRVEMVGQICDSIAYAPALTSAVAAPNWSAKVQVFPNPTTDFLQLAVGQGLTIRNLKLIDIYGRLIEGWDELPDKIRLQERAAGVYWLKMQSNRGLITKQIIVE